MAHRTSLFLSQQFVLCLCKEAPRRGLDLFVKDSQNSLKCLCVSNHEIIIFTFSSTIYSSQTHNDGSLVLFDYLYAHQYKDGKREYTEEIGKTDETVVTAAESDVFVVFGIIFNLENKYILFKHFSKRKKNHIYIGDFAVALDDRQLLSYSCYLDCEAQFLFRFF